MYFCKIRKFYRSLRHGLEYIFYILYIPLHFRTFVSFSLQCRSLLAIYYFSNVLIMHNAHLFDSNRGFGGDDNKNKYFCLFESFLMANEWIKAGIHPIFCKQTEIRFLI